MKPQVGPKVLAQNTNTSNLHIVNCLVVTNSTFFRKGGRDLDKKRAIAAILLSFLFLLVFLFGQTEKVIVLTQSGDTFTSLSTVVPTIDGVISVGEWNDSQSANILLEYQDLYPNATEHEGVLYVKNDGSYLYLAAIVIGDDYDPMFPDYAVWWFDNDHDGIIEAGDDGLTIRSDGFTQDIYRPNTIEKTLRCSDLSDGGTDDLDGAVRYTNTTGFGEYTFECRHPLDTSDNLHDFSLQPGNTVGFQFQYIDSSLGIGNDVAMSVIQTADGGYAMAGYSDSYGTAGDDFWLVKTDNASNPEWSRVYGGEDDDYAWSVIQTSDGGYALTGAPSYYAGTGDFWLIKLDSSGNLEWNKSYGGAGLDAAACMIEASDGGYVLAGLTESFGAGQKDWWWLKTDSYGNVEWNRTIGGAYDDTAYSIIQTSDGGYALAGFTSSFGAGGHDFWLVKTDSHGNVEWNRTIGGAYDDTAYSVIQTSDGGYALAGETLSYGLGNYDFWLVKVDSSGIVNWTQPYGGVNVDSAWSIVQTGDGGYVLAGYTDSVGVDRDVWMVWTDSAGDMQWSEAYGDTGQGSNEVALSMVQTSDGGYALAGYSQFFSSQGYDFWLVKTNSTGEVQWDWAYAQAVRAQWPASDYGDIIIAEPPSPPTSSPPTSSPPTGTRQPTGTTPPTGTTSPETVPNEPPLAFIASVRSNSDRGSSIEEEPVSFRGYGLDADGVVVGYRWTSSIDGVLSYSKDFSTSNLSVGSHTIYFEVQDDNGDWSIAVEAIFEVQAAFPLSIVLVAVSVGVGGSSGLGLFLHFHGKPEPSLRIENRLKKKWKREAEKNKKEEERKKREIEKGHPFLQVETKLPSRVMESTSHEALVKIKNVGTKSAEKVLVKTACTPGLTFNKTQDEVLALPPKEHVVVRFPFAASKQIKKGLYKIRVKVISKGALNRTKTCHTRAIRIGVLSDNESQEYAELFKKWLKDKSYTFRNLTSADNLRVLLRFDFLILPAILELSPDWVGNISSFVRNGQSLWVIDKVKTKETKLLAEMLGYSDLHYKRFECDQGSIRVCDGEHYITKGMETGEVIPIGKSWGNVCISKISTGKVLAYHDCFSKESESKTVSLPAIIANEHGNGKVVHFNFHIEKCMCELNQILERTLDWLLFEH